MAESSPVGIWQIDVEGRTIYVNPAMCDLLQVEGVDDIRGQSFRDFFTASSVKRIEQEQQRRQEGYASTYEATLIGQQGRRLIVSIAAGPVRRDGKIDSFVGFITDITQRRQTTSALQEAHAQLEATFNALPDLMFVIDSERRILDYRAPNPGWLHADPEQFLGKPFDAILPEEAGRTITNALNEAQRSGHHIGASYELQTRTGKQWFELSIAAQGQPGAPDTRYVVLVRDITRLDRMERALRESEESYRTLFHSSPVGLGIANMEGKLLDFNDAMLEPGGYTREEIEALGDVNALYANPEQRSAVLELAREHGVVNRVPVRFLRKDGSIYHTRLSLRRVTFRGQPAWLALVEDVTDRVEQEAILEQYTARLRTLREIDRAILVAQSPPDIARAALRRISKIVPCSRASVAVFDMEEELVEMLAVLHPDESSIQVGQHITLDEYGIEEPLHHNEVYHCTDLSKHSDHSSVEQTLLDEGILSYVSVPLLYHGDLIGALNLGADAADHFQPEFIDIAREVANQLAIAIQQARLNEQVRRHADELEERVAERTAELEAANEYLRQLSILKDEFVSNVSHELRTPITNLKLHHRLIKEKPDRHDRYIKTLVRETQRLEHIVETLLTLSQIDQKHMLLSLAPIDLNQLIAQYVDDRTLLAASRDLTLAFHPAPDLPPVPADRFLIGEAVSVLLTNALNYTPPGGEISVSTTHQHIDGQPHVRLTVRDTGPGIPAEERPHIFERFYRGTVGRNSGMGGTGLGLSLAHEIVKRHNGRITVDNHDSDTGASFSITLPLHSLQSADSSP